MTSHSSEVAIWAARVATLVLVAFGLIGVRRLVVPPGAEHITMRLARDGHYTGPAQSRVTIVQFSDMTCGHCIELAGTLARIRADIPGVAMSYRHAMLVPDQATIGAARALVCADEQGRFWETYQRLATRPIRRPTIDNLARLADTVGLRRSEFLSCLDAPSTDARIDRDAAVARDLRMKGTPLLLVNEITFRGNPPADSLVALVSRLATR